MAAEFTTGALVMYQIKESEKGQKTNLGNFNPNSYMKGMENVANKFK